MAAGGVSFALLDVTGCSRRTRNEKWRESGSRPHPPWRLKGAIMDKAETTINKTVAPAPKARATAIDGAESRNGSS